VLVALGTQHAIRMSHIFICGLASSTVFFYITKSVIFEKILLNTKCVFWFSLQLTETFLILRRTEREYGQRCVLVFMNSTRNTCLIWVRLDCSWHILEKYSNIKFHADPSNGSRADPNGRAEGRMGRPTDRQTWQS